MQTVKARSHLFEGLPDVGRSFVEQYFVSDDDFLTTALNLRWWSRISKAHHAEVVDLFNQPKLGIASQISTRYAVPREIDALLESPNYDPEAVQESFQALVDQYRNLYLNLGMRSNWYPITAQLKSVNVVFNDRKLERLVVDLSPRTTSRDDKLADHVSAIIDQLSLAVIAAGIEKRSLPAIRLRYVGPMVSNQGAEIILKALTERPDMINALTSMELRFRKHGRQIVGMHHADTVLPMLLSYLKQTTSLSTLVIAETPLSGQRCYRIAAALCSNSSVEKLYFHECGLVDSDAEYLMAVLAKNLKIKLLELHYNAFSVDHPIWDDPRVKGRPCVVAS